MVDQLVESFASVGVARDNIFYQPDISVVDQESHWISQWLYAQRHSKVVVCILSCAYLRSKPCCTEWKLTQEWQRLVVNVDSPANLLKTELTGFNGPVLAYVQCGEQMLDARTLTSAQLVAKILEKFELNKDKSHAFELRRGSPSGGNDINNFVFTPSPSCRDSFGASDSLGRDSASGSLGARDSLGTCSRDSLSSSTPSVPSSPELACLEREGSSRMMSPKMLLKHATLGKLLPASQESKKEGPKGTSPKTNTTTVNTTVPTTNTTTGTTTTATTTTATTTTASSLLAAVSLLVKRPK